jgi:hypothetical protein
MPEVSGFWCGTIDRSCGTTTPSLPEPSGFCVAAMLHNNLWQNRLNMFLRLGMIEGNEPSPIIEWI